MDYNVNTLGEESLQHYDPQYQYQGYPPVYKRPWFWIVIAAVLAAAAVVTVLLVSGGTPQRFELTGNSGVVAAYDFLCSEQDNQDKLASSVMKELGERLNNEPFEIECTAKMNMDSHTENYFPIRDIAIGIYAKYDLKDFGIKLGSMGMDVISGYLIDNNIVVSLMGRAGCISVKLPEDSDIEKNMGLEERIKAFLPFLPDDEVFFTLLEKIAHSVPEKYTKDDTALSYSPKDDKEVRMDVIETTLDSQAIKEIMLNFSDEIKGDKKLTKQLQDVVDKFTEFAGLESKSIDDLVKDLEESADTEALNNIKISWSVYKRHGSLVGISLNISAKDTNYKYTYISEYEGNDSYTYTATDINGVKTEAIYSYNWQGNKVKMSGEINTKVSEGTGNTTQLLDGVMEFSKDGGNEYIITGDISIEGNIYNDILNSQGSESYDMKIDATIKVGGGLGTLKEDRDWNDIYEREWGSMEDTFGWLFPDYSDFFDYGNGNNL